MSRSHQYWILLPITLIILKVPVGRFSGRVQAMGHGTIFRDQGFDVDDISLTMVKYSTGAVFHLIYAMPYREASQQQDKVFGLK